MTGEEFLENAGRNLTNKLINEGQISLRDTYKELGVPIANDNIPELDFYIMKNDGKGFRPIGIGDSPYLFKGDLKGGKING